MEFQNQPFQDLKERVAALEKWVEVLQKEVERLDLGCRGFPITTEKSETVLEKQDDERGRTLFKTMEEVQEEKEAGS